MAVALVGAVGVSQPAVSLGADKAGSDKSFSDILSEKLTETTEPSFAPGTAREASGQEAPAHENAGTETPKNEAAPASPQERPVTEAQGKEPAKADDPAGAEQIDGKDPADEEAAAQNVAALAAAALQDVFTVTDDLADTANDETGAVAAIAADAPVFPLSADTDGLEGQQGNTDGEAGQDEAQAFQGPALQDTAVTVKQPAAAAEAGIRTEAEAGAVIVAAQTPVEEQEAVETELALPKEDGEKAIADTASGASQTSAVQQRGRRTAGIGDSVSKAARNLPRSGAPGKPPSSGVSDKSWRAVYDKQTGRPLYAYRVVAVTKDGTEISIHHAYGQIDEEEQEKGTSVVNPALAQSLHESQEMEMVLALDSEQMGESLTGAVSTEVVKQLELIAQAEEGKMEFRMELEPRYLGKIDIKMVLEGGVLVVEIISSTKTNELLSRQVEALAASIRAANEDITSVQIVTESSASGYATLDNAFQGDSQARQQYGGDSGGGRINGAGQEQQDREDVRPQIIHTGARQLNYAI